MKHLRLAAGVFIMIAVFFFSALPSIADYQFDDINGPSGISSQWVIINDETDTFGASHSQAMQISADLLTSGTAAINVINGTPSSVTDRNLQTFFLVVAEGQGDFDMNLRSQTVDFDVSTPGAVLDTTVDENSSPYIGTMQANQSGNNSSAWRNYHFRIARNNDTRNAYDTVIQSFYFQQNATGLPSSGIPRAMVISNVHLGTAADASSPLIVRTTLRDSSGTNASNGNIIAYDRTSWRMNKSTTTDNPQWVFIPVDDLNTDNKSIPRHLTTEVANNSAYRYGVTYSSGTGATEPPYEWKFDMFRPQGATNIPARIILNPESNIAPGLVTVYRRNYNVNEQNKTPLHVFGVDTSDRGHYALTLNHRIIYGEPYGTPYTYQGEGRFNLYEVTAFKPKLASNESAFLNRVANITESAGTVGFPKSMSFSSTSVTRETPEADVIAYFTVNQTAVTPSGATEGIMPLHITFNIPVTLVQGNTWWNEMLQEWRKSGRIEAKFAEKYNLYLRSANGRLLNLTQELEDKGVYDSTVKVFYDDERGVNTRDNVSGLLTVSFMGMMMNGTRDGVRPELSIVSDDSNLQQNNYIVIRDGVNDSKWNLEFLIAPAGWYDNPNRQAVANPVNNNTRNNSGGSAGSSGGGCGVFAVIPGLFALIPAMRKYRREGRL